MVKWQILAVFAGMPKVMGGPGSDSPGEKPWESGIFKDPVSGPVWLSYGGLRGDGQADRKHHGGPDKAVCAYCAEHYQYWRTQPRLGAIGFGGFGENLSLGGADETGLCIGDRFELGEAVVEVSQPRQPCWKLARRWGIPELKEHVERKGYTGFYFRVIRHGWVKAGDSGVLLERPWPQWTLAECNSIMHHRPEDHAAALRLSECPPLSGSWKDNLFERARQGADR